MRKSSELLRECVFEEEESEDATKERGGESSSSTPNCTEWGSVGAECTCEPD